MATSTNESNSVLSSEQSDKQLAIKELQIKPREYAAAARDLAGCHVVSTHDDCLGEFEVIVGSKYAKISILVDPRISVNLDEKKELGIFPIKEAYYGVEAHQHNITAATSVLLDLGNDKYMYVCSEVYVFDMPDGYKLLYSRKSGDDNSPLPYLHDMEGHIWLLAERVKLNKRFTPKQARETDFYHNYFNDAYQDIQQSYEVLMLSGRT